jgi:sugar phosphate isomerase/epimerase
VVYAGTWRGLGLSDLRQLKSHLPWPEIVAALRDIRYDGPVVIESFTP